MTVGVVHQPPRLFFILEKMFADFFSIKRSCGECIKDTGNGLDTANEVRPCGCRAGECQMNRLDTFMGVSRAAGFGTLDVEPLNGRFDIEVKRV